MTIHERLGTTFKASNPDSPTIADFPSYTWHLVVLPFFAALEMLLRGPGATGVWLPLAGKLLALVVIVVGALLGLLPFIFLLGIVPIAAYFLIFELVGYRMSRHMPNPWSTALLQAAFTSSGFGAVMPFVG